MITKISSTSENTTNANKNHLIMHGNSKIIKQTRIYAQNHKNYKLICFT